MTVANAPERHPLRPGADVHRTLAERLLHETDPSRPCSDPDEHVARLELALELIRRLGHVGAVDVVEALAISSRHAGIRWKAVETLLSLDVQVGLRALCRALRDDHAQVRHAAATAVEALGQEPADRAA